MGQDFGRLGAGFPSARGRIPVGSGPDSRPSAREGGARDPEFRRPFGDGPGPGRGPGPRWSGKSAEIINFMKFYGIS